MPKIAIIRNVTFFIYSGDINERRRHIHIEIKKGRYRKSAKFWLEPKIEIVNLGGISKNEIIKLIKIINVNFDLIDNQLTKFYNGERIKVIKVK